MSAQSGSIKREPTLDVDNVAGAILYMDALRLDANVPSMTVMAPSTPYIGSG